MKVTEMWLKYSVDYLTLFNCLLYLIQVFEYNDIFNTYYILAKQL